MEIETFLIVGYGFLHLAIGLVADNVIDFFEFDCREFLVDGFSVIVFDKARQEQSFVILSLDESMGSISVCLHCRDHNNSVLVLELSGGVD